MEAPTPMQGSSLSTQSFLQRWLCSTWRWALLTHVVSSQVAQHLILEVITIRRAVGYGCSWLPELSIQATGYHLPSLFFRVVIVDYSLNNGVTFQDQNLKMTSRKCVSVMVLLCKAPAVEGQIPFRGKRGEQWLQAVPDRTASHRSPRTFQPPLGQGWGGADPQLKLGNYPGCSQMSRPCRTSAFSVNKCRWCTWRRKLELQQTPETLLRLFPCYLPPCHLPWSRSIWIPAEMSRTGRF